MQYYAALQRNEILTHATIEMDLEDFMLSEEGQPQKDKHCVTVLSTRSLEWVVHDVNPKSQVLDSVLVDEPSCASSLGCCDGPFSTEQKCLFFSPLPLSLTSCPSAGRRVTYPFHRAKLSVLCHLALFSSC